ncbi:hypothetical protein CU097_003492 [Rhizopus azygosporus]|uniref:Cytochrome P450-dit2 n=1 Tax=Rhizopus azygosporus TaxID=86630 RepID=A0A367JSF3_RHIAZ|nr:hypothetical protein CU097_003492 [Rhizopus azygosporus]
MTGHMPLLGQIPGEIFTKWHHEYGPIFRIKMGVQNWLILGNAQIAHDILVSKGSVTVGRPEQTFLTKVHGKGGRGILMIDYGKRWKNIRNVVLHILSPKSVDSLSSTIERESEKGARHVMEVAELNGTIDPLEFGRFISTNLMLAIAFNIPSAKDVDDPTFKEIVKFVKTNSSYADFTNDISEMVPILKLPEILLRRDRKMQRHVDNELCPFMRQIIKDARESSGDSLVKKIDSIKEEYDIDETGVIFLMSEILHAESDSVGITTAWSISLLCSYPDVQEKVYKEVNAFIKRHGRDSTFADRKELPYFIAFEKECIRFRAAVDIGLPHKVFRDFNVITKGTIIYVNVNKLHSGPKLYINGSHQSRDHFMFGWGRRICPGIYMTKTELFYTLIKLVSRCITEPELSPDEERLYPDLQHGINTGVSVTPLPFKIRLIKRDNSNY